MKTLRLVFSRIGTYFSRNKTIFVLYIVGMIVCVITLIFLYGNFMSSKSGIYKNEFSCRSVRVYFRNPVTLTNNDIEEFQNFYMDGKIQEIQLSAVLDKNGNDSFDFCTEDIYEGEGTQPAMCYIDGDPDIDPDDYIIVDSYLNNNNDMMANPKPNLFSNDQLKQSVAAAPKDKNGSIRIQGEDFNIVENITSDNYVIPIEKYMSSNIRTCYMHIYTDSIWSEFAITEYVNYLKAVFDDANYSYSIYDPLPFYQDLNNQNIQNIQMLMVVFGCTMLSFMFLLKYLMDCARYENGILMMVGAKRTHILLMNFLENIILTLFCIIAASLIHIGLYSVFFSKINIFEKLEYYPQDYVIIAGMVLAALIIIQIPFMIVYWKNNIKSIKEGGR